MSMFFAFAPLAGLVFFFLVFVGIFISVARPGAKQRLQVLALIPLKEDVYDRSE